MRKGDEVFLFTLVDFLLQVFFFALLLFVVNLAMQKQEDEKRGLAETEQERLLKSVGVSNLTELSDLLTKMAKLRAKLYELEQVVRSNGVNTAARSPDPARSDFIGTTASIPPTDEQTSLSRRGGAGSWLRRLFMGQRWAGSLASSECVAATGCTVSWLLPTDYCRICCLRLRVMWFADFTSANSSYIRPYIAHQSPKAKSHR
jgi:hypothetical protein